MADGYLPAVFLVVMLLCSGTGESSSLSSVWKQELPNAAMPAQFEKLASPLSSSDVQIILSKINTGPVDASAVTKEFCASAGVYCPQKDVVIPVNGPQPRVCIPPFFNYEYGVLPCRPSAAEVSAVQASGIFLTQNNLIAGKKVLLPDTTNDLQGRKFLALPLARSLPKLEAGSMMELARFYGVQTGSDMELEMKNTLAHCGFKSTREVRTCQVSGEGVVSFASELAGHNAAVVTVPVAVPKQTVTIRDVVVVSKPGDRTVSCHNMKFPSLLYSCHMTQTAQVMDVSVMLASGHLAHVPVVCHMDTSYWNPSHIAFQALNVQPGKSSVCHWFPENTFVFVGKNNA